MSIVTYDRVPAATVAVASKRKTDRKGFWARAFDRLIEARSRQAHEHLARHRELLNDLRRHAPKA